MQIRKAEERDIADMIRLLGQVNMVHHLARPDLFKGPATKYNAEELKQMLDDEDNPIFVYDEENDAGGSSMLGYIFCRTEICEESPLRTGLRTLYVDDLCVDERARGKHVGKALYEYTVDYARRNDYYNLTLHVWGGNDGAQAFYEKMGMKTQYTCLEQIL